MPIITNYYKNFVIINVVENLFGEFMDKFVVVLCTVDNLESAKKIARIVVEERLAACANIMQGLSSIYHWEGEIVEDSECLLILKTKATLFEVLKNKILEIHPYEVPEIISLGIDNGFDKYLDWIKENTL